jgi:nucleotide-binding universal stress UspA family protein
MDATPRIPPAKIVLATDLSSRGDRALDRAALLADRWGAKLLVVHALRDDAMGDPHRLRGKPSWRQPTDAAAAIERQIRRDLGSRAVDLSVLIEEGNPVDVILGVIGREGADLAVLGAEAATAAGGASLGNTVEQVIRRSPISTLLVKTRPHGPYRRLLVGTDFTDESRYGLEVAAALFPDAEFALMHSYDLPYKSLYLDNKLGRDFQKMERDTIEAFVAKAGLPEAIRSRVKTLIEHGSPDLMLRDYVEDKEMDLTVIGALGRGALFHFVIGGNTPKIVEAVPSDVLIVRAHPEN